MPTSRPPLRTNAQTTPSASHGRTAAAVLGVRLAARPREMGERLDAQPLLREELELLAHRERRARPAPARARERQDLVHAPPARERAVVRLEVLQDGERRLERLADDQRRRLRRAKEGGARGTAARRKGVGRRR